jgi:hypothetical protein
VVARAGAAVDLGFDGRAEPEGQQEEEESGELHYRVMTVSHASWAGVAAGLGLAGVRASRRFVCCVSQISSRSRGFVPKKANGIAMRRRGSSEQQAVADGGQCEA